MSVGEYLKKNLKLTERDLVVCQMAVDFYNANANAGPSRSFQEAESLLTEIERRYQKTKKK